MKTHIIRICSIAALLPIQLFAQNDSLDNIELAPFTVTADRAQSILQITERDLSQRQATDLEDALSIDPSITVGGSTGVAQKVYVRNLGEELLNVSIDGATQSGALFSHIGRIAVEPDLLKRVDVQSGIGNATDGPGALGGTIRFVSKDPADFLRDDQDIGALFKYGYYGNTGGYKASANIFGQFNDTWSGLLSYVSSDYDELEDPDGNKSPGSASEQEVLFAKIVGEFANGQSLKLSFENIQDSGDKLRRPEWSFVDASNPIWFMKTERDTAAATYLFDSQEHEWLNLEARLSYTTSSMTQDKTPDPVDFFEVENIQLYLANTQILMKHELTYGLDYREDETSAGTLHNAADNMENNKVTGLFIQNSFQATDVLAITAGARFDQYELDDREGQNFTNDAFSPNLGLVYEISSDFTVKASSTHAYRGPDLNTAAKLSSAQNAPDITGEDAHSEEISLTYAKDGITLEMGLFQNHIENLIGHTTVGQETADRPIPWGSYYTNIGKLKSDGFYIRANYGTENYNISLLYNNANTTVNGHTPTRYQYGSTAASIGNTWVLDAFWKANKQVDLGWNIRLVEGIHDVAFSIPGVLEDESLSKPGYATHDFYLRWRPEFSKNLSFNLTVKNVFDKLYRNHGGMEDFSHIYPVIIGANEPGRDLRLSASIAF